MRLMVFAVTVSFFVPASWGQGAIGGKTSGDLKHKNISPDQAHFERGQRKLEGPLLLKYLRDQLSLSREQKPKWEQLIGYYKSKRSEMNQNLATQTEELRRIQEALVKARAAGDKDKIKELKAEQEKLVPAGLLMDETLQIAQGFLTHGQNRRLGKLLEAIKQGKPIDLRLKPREAVAAAEALGLNGEQRTAIGKLEDGFRIKMATLRVNDEDGRTEAMEDFLEDIRKILSPAQIEGFEQHIMGRAKALQQQDDAQLSDEDDGDTPPPSKDNGDAPPDQKEPAGGTIQKAP